MTETRTTETVSLTIGWTKHAVESRYAAAPRAAHIHHGKAYMPFWDTFQPGQAQHTITVELELERAELLSGPELAEAAFTATNAPYVPEGTIPALILDAVQATGYRGEEAHYSLSVGDTVEVRGTVLGAHGEETSSTVWACGRSGWTEVSA